MTDPIRILMELKVDPDVFDLTRYNEMAVDDGWADDPENGALYLADEIADDRTTTGCTLSVPS